MQLLTLIMDSYASACGSVSSLFSVDTVGGAVSTEAQFRVGSDKSSVKIEFWNIIRVQG